MSQPSKGGVPERRFERRFPPEPVSAPAARLFIDEIGWEDDIETRRRLAAAVSEVVTNSILHARTDFSVEVTVRDDRVRVVVKDESPELPIRQLFDSLQPTGRGLLILDEIADRWGYSPEAAGKSVWFEIERRRASVDH